MKSKAVMVDDYSVDNFLNFALVPDRKKPLKRLIHKQGKFKPWGKPGLMKSLRYSKCFGKYLIISITYIAANYFIIVN